MHTPYDGDFTFFNHLLQYRTPLLNGFNRSPYIDMGDFFYELTVLGVAVFFGRLFILNRRPDLSKQCSQIAHFYVVACSFYGSAFGMSQHNDDFGAGYLTAKLHTTQNIFVDYISSNTNTENVA